MLKDGRSGLGRSSFLQEQERQKTVKKQEHEEQAVTHFLQWKQQKPDFVKKWRETWTRSQRACEQLDREAGYTAPTMPWYWVSVQERSGEDGEIDSDDSDSSEETYCEDTYNTL